ncbi:HopJ type III effector protein [Photobacterium sanguinicancri]|uniref:HopJ type III effector protein n=1 Tax=Photobacterium sanguinicancri TaxID=875932 RepID=UPI0021C39E64|nr:HopJ type III effector protein [Photobacterium sanguinicancri]
MELSQFLAQLKHDPSHIEFEQTMAIIDQHYTFTPTAFSNGDVSNQAGENNGSCKILSFGQRNALTEKQTLACFGRFYRDDVLKHPHNTDHLNIRNFIQYGWNGVTFDSKALESK